MRLSLIVLTTIVFAVGSLVSGCSKSPKAAPPATSKASAPNAAEALSQSQAADMLLSFVALTASDKPVLKDFQDMAILSPLTEYALGRGLYIVQEIMSEPKAAAYLATLKPRFQSIAMKAKFGKYRALFPKRQQVLTPGVDLGRCVGLLSDEIDVGFCPDGDRWKVLVDPDVTSAWWPFKRQRSAYGTASPPPQAGTTPKLSSDRPKDWNAFGQQVVAALADKDRGNAVRRLLPTSQEVGSQAAQAALSDFNMLSSAVPGKHVPWSNPRILAVDPLEMGFFGESAPQQAAVLWVAANDETTVWVLVIAKVLDDRMVIVTNPVFVHQGFNDSQTCSIVADNTASRGWGRGPTVRARIKELSQQCAAQLKKRPDARPLMNFIAQSHSTTMGFLWLQGLLRREPSPDVIKVAHARKSTFKPWKVPIDSPCFGPPSDPADD